MQKRGEITVFLSLVLVCMLSLILSLLESARTTGARLYAQMAADSAAASVMSQYNRNLWEMYHLLFLEAESESAIVHSFSDYLKYYTIQDNLYPMELLDVDIEYVEKMMDNGGKGLEAAVLSYMNNQVMDVLGNLGEQTEQISESADMARKTEDFREWFEVCRKAGEKSRRLDRYYRKANQSLGKLRLLKEELLRDRDDETEETWEISERWRKQFFKETEKFFEYTDAYEEELNRISMHLMELRKEEQKDSQLILAYEEVELEGRRILETFLEEEGILKRNLEILEQEDKNSVLISQLEIPGKETDTAIDQEKSSALDRLEDFFQGSVLDLVLPEGTEISKKTISLKAMPSAGIRETEKSDPNGNTKEIDEIISHVLVNEYCFCSFDSFLEKCDRRIEVENQPLEYEQEYLLCGLSSDRENLASTVEKLMAIRGAANFTCLLGSMEKRTEADQLAAAVTGGNGPVMLLVSFFILTLWAFGEAVLDVKQLMIGGAVPYWKQEDEWMLSLEGLLTFQFMEAVKEKQQEGNTYQDHLRLLFFLNNQTVRNARMMDVMQLNLKTRQNDFAVADCFLRAEFSVKLQEQHLFFVKNHYVRTIKTVGVY